MTIKDLDKGAIKTNSVVCDAGSCLHEFALKAYGHSGKFMERPLDAKLWQETPDGKHYCHEHFRG